MNKTIAAFVILLIANTSFAQVEGGSNEKLANLYSSGKFEPCLLKAENIALNEKTKKDPEAYLYMSMCLYQLSKSENEQLAEEYKKGFKDAIKYINKFAKYDTDGEMYDDNITYINEIKDIQFSKIDEYYQEQDYKKAASETKQYNKLNREEDFTLVLFTGMCETLSGNSQGSRNIDEAISELNNQLKTGKVKVDSRFKTILPACIAAFTELKTDQCTTVKELGTKILPGN